MKEANLSFLLERPSQILAQKHVRFQGFVISSTAIRKKPGEAEGVWYAEMSSGNENMPCRALWYQRKPFQNVRICFRHAFHTH